MSLMDTLIAEPPPLRLDQQGVVRVGMTRVPLDTVIHSYQRGDSAEEIVDKYDVLSLADVYAVLSYYIRHRHEVDVYLEERRRLAEVVRRQNEARWPSEGLRKHLLARRKEMSDP